MLIFEDVESGESGERGVSICAAAEARFESGEIEGREWWATRSRMPFLSYNGLLGTGAMSGRSL